MWEYRVRAVNNSGGGPWARAIVGVPARAPSAPDLTATALSSTEILLQWNIPLNNGSDIDGFEIQQWAPTGDNGGIWGTGNLLAADNNGDDNLSDEPGRTSYNVTGLSGGDTYYFRIRTLDTTGNMVPRMA